MMQTTTDKNIRETILKDLRNIGIDYVYFTVANKGNKWLFIVSENPETNQLDLESKCLAQVTANALKPFTFIIHKAVELNKLDEFIEWVSDLYNGLLQEEYPDVYCIHYETHHSH